jgi:methylthioribose-1-phosphate isomerase
VLARHHGLPLYVAAPVSTIDLCCADGAAIPVERRPPAEVAEIGGRRVTPDGVAVDNRAFDVTPAALVTAIITDEGVARSPYQESLAAMVRSGNERGSV